MTWIADKTTKGLVKNGLSVSGLLAALVFQPAQAMTFSEALELALEHDPLVPLSEATYEADLQLGRQITGERLPVVTVDGTVAKNDNESESQFFGTFEEDFNSSGIGITARQPVFRLDWFAKGRHADALDSQALYSKTEREMAYGVRLAERYFAVLVAQDELKLARAEAKAIGESLSDTKKRHEVGLVPGTDLKEAQARDDLAKAKTILARQKLVSAQDALNESTGQGYVALPALPSDVNLPPLDPADIEVWVARARAKNPGILQAREAVTIAKSNLSAARAELLPVVDAVASYRHDDSSDSRVGSERNDARLALELTVPLYQGGIKHARSREAQARMIVAERDLDRKLAEIDSQMRQQYREVETAYTQTRALELAVASAIAAEEATRNGYQAGTRTITDVLNARSAVISAQRDLSRTRYDLLLGRMKLKQITAEMTREDYQAVDALLDYQQKNEADE